MKMVLGALVISILVGGIAFWGLLALGLPMFLAILGYVVAGAVTTLIVMVIYAQVLQGPSSAKLSGEQNSERPTT